MTKKTLVALITACAILSVAIVGTLAYLTSVSNPIKNVFSIGNVDVTLVEEGDGTPDEDAPADAPVNRYKLIPLSEMKKDAKLTVSADSESAYLFAVMNEVCTCPKGEDGTYDFSDYIDYEVTSDWTALPDVDGVYYCMYTAQDPETAEDKTYQIIKDGKVTVKDITDDQILAANTDEVEISLTIQAGAVQASNIAGEDEDEKLANAWNAIKGKFAAFAETETEPLPEKEVVEPEPQP